MTAPASSPSPDAPETDDATEAGLFSRLWNAFDGLAADTLWSGAHDGLQLITAFTSFYLLNRSLSLAEYGAYLGLYGLLGALGAITFAGVGLALLQRLLGEGDDPNEAFRSFFTLSLLLGLSGTVLVIALAAATLDLTVYEIAMIVVAEVLLVAMIFLASIAVQARSGFAAAVRVNGVVIPIRLAVVVTLAATDSLTIANLATGIVIGLSLYVVYILGIHLPRHGYTVSLGRPSRLSLRASFLFSAPMGASKLQTDADKYLLNVFRHGADAGLYGAAYRMVLLGTLPLLALETAAFQRFLPKGEGVPGLHLRRSTRLASLMFVASLFVAAAIYVLLPFLDFLFSAEFAEAVDIVPWLLVLIPLISTSGTPLNGLLGLGLPEKRMWVYIGSAVISIVLYMALIPAFSWEGALVATIVSEVFLSVAGWSTLWYYQRRADEELAAGTAPDALTGAAPPS